MRACLMFRESWADRLLGDPWPMLIDPMPLFHGEIPIVFRLIDLSSRYPLRIFFPCPHSCFSVWNIGSLPTPGSGHFLLDRFNNFNIMPWKLALKKFNADIPPKSPMNKITWLVLRTAVLAVVCRLNAADASPAKEATIYRDEFGIPHVFGPTLEGAAYAVGYAQAEDRLEELLKN